MELRIFNKITPKTDFSRYQLWPIPVFCCFPRMLCLRMEVEKLEAALAATQHGVGFNNRVPQPLNHRIVSSMGVVKWLYAADGDAAANAGV